MKKTKEKKGRRKGEVILLEDLAPRDDILGGSGRILFGQHVEAAKPPARKGKSPNTDTAQGPEETE